MKTTIPAIEKAIAGEIKTVEELGMNLTFFRAYKKSKHAGNEIINFTMLYGTKTLMKSQRT